MLNFSKIEGVIGKILRKILKLLPLPKTVRVLQGGAFGFRWRRDSGVNGYWLGSYEKDKQQAFIRACQQIGGVVYDIGANVGFYSLIAARYVNQVYAFEPQPDNVRYLKEHVRINGLKNIKVFEFAVGEDNYKSTITGSKETSKVNNEINGFDIDVKSIDSLKDIEPPTIMKIDVEGYELKVLKGAEETIRKYKPLIFYDSMGVEEEFHFIKELGYTVHDLSQTEGRYKHYKLLRPATN